MPRQSPPHPDPLPKGERGVVPKYGPWALVAGASLGMGAEYSRQLAARGLNVFMIAEAADPLESLARSLADEHGVETIARVVDLADARGLTEIVEATAALEIGLLVYNAAASIVGRFLDVPLEKKLTMLDVNCRGLLVLADHFGRLMAARKRGGIIVMSSLAGFQGQAMVGTYAATKAFDLVLGEVLWEELGDHGVDVLAVCPGATRTPGFLGSRPREGAAGARNLADPAHVVTEALAAIGHGPTRIAGRTNRLVAFVLHRLLPRRAQVRFMSRATRAMYE